MHQLQLLPQSPLPGSTWPQAQFPEQGLWPGSQAWALWLELFSNTGKEEWDRGGPY